MREETVDRRCGSLCPICRTACLGVSKHRGDHQCAIHRWVVKKGRRHQERVRDVLGGVIVETSFDSRGSYFVVKKSPSLFYVSVWGSWHGSLAVYCVEVRDIRERPISE